MCIRDRFTAPTAIISNVGLYDTYHTVTKKMCVQNLSNTHDQQGGNRINMAAAIEFNIQMAVSDITSTKHDGAARHNIMTAAASTFQFLNGAKVKVWKITYDVGKLCGTFISHTTHYIS